MSEVKAYITTHRQIAVRVLNLLIGASHSEELAEIVAQLRLIENERNQTQREVAALQNQTPVRADFEMILDRMIGAMERMNDEAKSILERLETLIKPQRSS